MEIDDIIKSVVEIIRKYLSNEYRILLFGSQAKGNAIKTSDIDMGILGSKKVDWSKMVQILEKVDNLLTLRKIDVVDLNTVEDKFRNNVLKYAKSL